MSDRKQMRFESGELVTILTAEDFEGYDYNKPGDAWELARFPDGSIVWVSHRALSMEPSNA
jgi:hypothetical protein